MCVNDKMFIFLMNALLQKNFIFNQPLYPFLLCIQRDRLSQCCCERSSPQQRSTGERSSSVSMSVPVLDLLYSLVFSGGLQCFTSRHNALKFSAWNSRRLSCLEQFLSVFLQIPSCVWSPKMIRLEFVWILQSYSCHGRDSSIIQAN